MRHSELIGKQIFTRDGNFLGTAIGAILEKNLSKVAALRCADAEEEEFFLPFPAVQSYATAIITRADGEKYSPRKEERLEQEEGENPSLPDFFSYPAAPIGKKVLSVGGEELGVCSDFLFLGRSARMLVSREREILSFPTANLRVNEVVIVAPFPARSGGKGTGEKRAKTVRTEKEIAKTPTAREESPQPKEKEGRGEEISPRREKQSSFDRFDLLGRYVRRSVFSANGSLLFREGELITPYLLRIARENNKLLELTVATLTDAR